MTWKLPPYKKFWLPPTQKSTYLSIEMVARGMTIYTFFTCDSGEGRGWLALILAQIQWGSGTPDDIEYVRYGKIIYLIGILIFIFYAFCSQKIIILQELRYLTFYWLGSLSRFIQSQKWKKVPKNILALSRDDFVVLLL